MSGASGVPNIYPPQLPNVTTAAGLTPQAPADLYAQLIGYVAILSPGYTANLPGSLIDDVAGTDTGALVLMDQARVETVASLSPMSANPWLLLQLGQLYGVPFGTQSNTSVEVVFSGSPGYVLPQGFVISDGTNQYTLDDGGVIATSGQSLLLSATATVSGTFAVPPNTVTQLITSVPTGVTLTVTNPGAGLPGTAAPTEAQYRGQVVQAGLASAIGMPRFLKTKLQAIPGVQARLTSVRQLSTGAFEVICGGGDNYLVAAAIYQSVTDVSALSGSLLQISGVTQSNPAVFTTAQPHGYVTGAAVSISGAQGMTAINGGPYSIIVVDATHFYILSINSSSYPSYTGGGILTPNPRNVTVSISDYPDTYSITFVNPPQELVAMTITWNTSALNFVSGTAVAQLAQGPIVAYINSIPVGQPINLIQLTEVFQGAIESILDVSLLTRLVFSISINGTGVAPSTGTQIISGDPEAYFFTAVSDITINQG